jgi:hypothetical protein
VKSDNRKVARTPFHSQVQRRAVGITSPPGRGRAATFVSRTGEGASIQRNALTSPLLVSSCHPEPVRLPSSEVSLCHPERSRGTPDLSRRQPPHPQPRRKPRCVTLDLQLYTRVIPSRRGEESRLLLPLSQNGRGSKVRVLIQRALCARAIRFCPPPTLPWLRLYAEMPLCRRFPDSMSPSR